MDIQSSNTNDSQLDENHNSNGKIQKNALIIFTRNPELGKCKTRLAKTLGDQAALEIYKYLLNHTAQTSKKVSVDRFVFYSNQIMSNDIWNSDFFIKKSQTGTDLGERMENAFSELFQLGYEKCLIIGSDLLDLNAEIISEGFQKLNQHDYVIGPALDGGYYLFGMKKLHPKIFKNKAWGTESVREETLNDLQDYNLHLLKTLNDIDTFEDMAHYQQLKQFYSKHD